LIALKLGENLRTAIERLRTSTFDKNTIKETVKEIQRALISSDVEISHVLELSKKIEQLAFEETTPGVNKKEHTIKQTYELLAELLGGEPSPPVKPKKILLVGLNGNGKTTTAGKLANYYKKRGIKTGLLCADTFRPAALEQLKQISEKLEVPFYGELEQKDASTVTRNGIKELEKENCELIIVDSAGRSGLDEELKKEIIAVQKEIKAEHTWLVMGADVGQIAKKQAIAFQNSVGINGVIITRIDGSAKGGGALSACAATETPIYFIGTGEKTNDLEQYNATRFLSRIMGYGDLEGLLEKIKEIQDIEIDA
jgi:signal recognition particle subunit SRP54